MHNDKDEYIKYLENKILENTDYAKNRKNDAE